MFITIFDFPDIFTQIQTQNTVFPRPQLSNLISIYHKLSRKNGVFKAQMRSLQSLMDRNITNQTPLLQRISAYSNTPLRIRITECVTASSSARSISFLQHKILSQNLGKYLSIEGESTPIRVTTGPFDLELKTVYEVINIATDYLRVGLLTDYEWVNVSVSNIFAGDLTTSERELVTIMKKYFVGTVSKQLYSNFKITDFAIGNNLTEIFVDSNYVRVQFTYLLTVSDLPSTLVSRITNTKVDLIMTRDGLDKFNNRESFYSDVVWVNEERNSSNRWKSKFCLANSFTEGALKIIKTEIWPDNNIFAIIERVKRTITRVDHVWVAACKGIGKSVFSDFLPNFWLIIDSDVKGKLLTLILGDPILEDLCSKKDFQNIAMKEAMLKCMTDHDDEIVSVYEVAAAQYVTDNAITLDSLLANRCDFHYNRFISCYNKLSTPLASTSNGFFTLSGAMLNFYNERFPSDSHSSKRKVLQFTHNANELYGAMSDAIYSLESTVNTIPFHLRRVRSTPPVVQIFLTNFYIHTDTFTTTPINLHTLFKATVDPEMRVVV